MNKFTNFALAGITALSLGCSDSKLDQPTKVVTNGEKIFTTDVESIRVRCGDMIYLVLQDSLTAQNIDYIPGDSVKIHPRVYTKNSFWSYDINTNSVHAFLDQNKLGVGNRRTKEGTLVVADENKLYKQYNILFDGVVEEDLVKNLNSYETHGRDEIDRTRKQLISDSAFIQMMRNTTASGDVHDIKEDQEFSDAFLKQYFSQEEIEWYFGPTRN